MPTGIARPTKEGLLATFRAEEVKAYNPPDSLARRGILTVSEIELQGLKVKAVQ